MLTVAVEFSVLAVPLPVGRNQIAAQWLYATGPYKGFEAVLRFLQRSRPKLEIPGISFVILRQKTVWDIKITQVVPDSESRDITSLFGFLRITQVSSYSRNIPWSN